MADTQYFQGGGSSADPGPTPQPAATTAGKWVDGGGGTWAWIPGSDGAGSTTPPPASPPPSATNTSQGIDKGVAAGIGDLQADLNRRNAASSGAFQNVQQSLAGSSILTPGQTTNVRPLSVAGAGRAPLTGLIGGSGVAPGNIAPGQQNQAAAGIQAPTPGTTTAANPAVAQAGQNAKDVLGPAPQIDMGLADRDRGAVQQAIGQSQQVVDQALAPVDQTQLNQSVSDARNVLNQLLNGQNTADRIGSQTLRSQLALARSAAGGPGAVQEAFTQAQQAAPELEAQAAQAGTAETLQRLGSAGNVAGAVANTSLGQQQNITNRIGTAATAAGGAAQAALGAQGQNIQVAQANLSAADNMINNIQQLTGTQLNVNQQDKNLIGQMARDAASMDYNWAGLDAAQQDVVFQTWIQAYGIDQSAAAQIKAAAAANHKSTMDYIMGFVGAAATIGSTAIPKM